MNVAVCILSPYILPILALGTMNILDDSSLGTKNIQLINAKCFDEFAESKFIGMLIEMQQSLRFCKPEKQKPSRFLSSCKKLHTLSFSNYQACDDWVFWKGQEGD